MSTKRSRWDSTNCPNCDKTVRWDDLYVCDPGCGRHACVFCRDIGSNESCPYCGKKSGGTCYTIVNRERFFD